MIRVIKIVLWIIVFILLTALTQIGGIILIISLILNRVWKSNFKLKPYMIFFGLYLIATFFIVPITAPIFGREKVIQTEKVKPATFMTVLLNRNYVRAELNELLQETEVQLKDSKIEIIYLDANFPFFNRFPLLPHLSHNDGKKIDLSLVYEDKNGEISNRKKSVSGYGVFENPGEKEENQTKKCKESGYYQYDYSKYFTFGKINRDLNFSTIGTKKLIESVLKSDRLGKLFIEPHLKQRLELKDQRIRYQGCHSVRHDDHIHIQLK